MLSHLLLCGPVDYNPQVPLSVGFFRQEYWGRVAISFSQGIFLDPVIESRISGGSFTGRQILTIASPGKPQ